MQDSDTTPWYRQFWPWFIILLLASSVSASLYTVSLAVRTTDSLVIVGEGGVDVVTERNLAAEQRAAELGLAARLSIDTESGAIAVEIDSRGRFDDRRTLELLFSHPTDARRDRGVTLAPAPPLDDGTPVWAGHIASVPTGRWYIVLRSGDAWRLSGAWTGAQRLELRPNRAGDGA